MNAVLLQIDRVALRAACLAVLLVALCLGVTGHAQTETNQDAASPPSSPQPTSRGFELGEFRIRVVYPVDAQKGAISFTLHATVSSDAAAQVGSLFDDRRHKIRDQVIVATRLVPLVAFDDPELTSLRRRILLRLRRALPELPIEDIYLSEFAIFLESA